MDYITHQQVVVPIVVPESSLCYPSE